MEERFPAPALSEIAVDDDSSIDNSKSELNGECVEGGLPFTIDLARQSSLS
jgi:hypothetical protein